ncbi:MAG: YlbF family regulator [Clostridia bacterium]|nr:YlbF family regulator [Clostridia bacterium]
MDIYDSANKLAAEIRQSPLRVEYNRLHQEVMGDETNRALLKEYKRLQMVLQMQAMSGAQNAPEDTARFAQLSSLLYMNADVQAYLLAEMNLQKALGDVIKLLTDAAGIQLDVFG